MVFWLLHTLEHLPLMAISHLRIAQLSKQLAPGDAAGVNHASFIGHQPHWMSALNKFDPIFQEFNPTALQQITLDWCMPGSWWRP